MTLFNFVVYFILAFLTVNCRGGLHIDPEPIEEATKVSPPIAAENKWDLNKKDNLNGHKILPFKKCSTGKNTICLEVIPEISNSGSAVFTVNWFQILLSKVNSKKIPVEFDESNPSFIELKSMFEKKTGYSLTVNNQVVTKESSTLLKTRLPEPVMEEYDEFQVFEKCAARICLEVRQRQVGDVLTYPFSCFQKTTGILKASPIKCEFEKAPFSDFKNSFEEEMTPVVLDLSLEQPLATTTKKVTFQETPEVFILNQPTYNSKDSNQVEIGSFQSNNNDDEIQKGLQKKPFKTHTAKIEKVPEFAERDNNLKSSGASDSTTHPDTDLTSEIKKDSENDQGVLNTLDSELKMSNKNTKEDSIFHKDDFNTEGEGAKNGQDARNSDSKLAQSYKNREDSLSKSFNGKEQQKLVENSSNNDNSGSKSMDEDHSFAIFSVCWEHLQGFRCLYVRQNFYLPVFQMKCFDKVIIAGLEQTTDIPCDFSQPVLTELKQYFEYTTKYTISENSEILVPDKDHLYPYY